MHGDWAAAIDEDGLWYVLGRSDDRLVYLSLRPPFCLVPAGITNPGYNGVVNQQKATKLAKGAATRETNFVLFVVFYSAL
ncbi:MAG: hypothetical protein DME60_13435 [Verrucomicrobia bacterium]|nr:MAG: hypothetical protein DME60_13435 [Verrucomicrobiota bacterium]